jgi:hypothetical protein
VPELEDAGAKDLRHGWLGQLTRFRVWAGFAGLGFGCDGLDSESRSGTGEERGRGRRRRWWRRRGERDLKEGV